MILMFMLWLYDMFMLWVFYLLCWYLSNDCLKFLYFIFLRNIGFEFVLNLVMGIVVFVNEKFSCL